MLTDRVDARPLAVARAGIGVAGLLVVLELRHTLGLVADGRVAVPVLRAAPAVTAGLVTWWAVAGVVAAVALTLGVRSRPAAGVLAGLTALALLWDQQTYSSHVLLLTLLAGYLSLVDAGAAWSLDAHRRGAAETVPRWPSLLIRTQLTAVYLFAALSKLNPRYLSGEPLRDWMSITPAPRIAASLALLSVLTELFLSAGLWFRVTRPAAFAAGIGLHLAIVATLEPTVPLAAFALLCVSCYPLYSQPRDSRVSPIVRSPAPLRVESPAGRRVPPDQP